MWQRIEKQLKSQLPFVVYRKPRHSDIQVVLQKNDVLNKVLDYSETGFVFAPFELKKDSYYIKVDEFYSEINCDLDTESNSIVQKLNQDAGRDAYIALLKKSIQEIESGLFRKVVLSRKIMVENNISPITLFKRIISLYTNAFCYLWFHPKVGLWLGATPEILLQTNGDLLTTMSLAGTLPYKRVSKPYWGLKEIDEQALVTEYILNALKGEVDNLLVSELETIRAGSLLHLRTKITGNLKSNNLNNIVRALHPTPAVCGFPKLEAMRFIIENENYNREFYAGFLGELNFGEKNSTTLYVNLRCMQQVENQMKIYVGGGVTKDSNPENEWQETVNKSRTMLRVLSN
ncbi:isochorismate synthase [Kriegella sp. EG-1]|nr:isochorismate synthase [Flavobacteriaceae bacterium EG-1]